MHGVTLNAQKKSLDSVNKLIELSKDENLTLESRLNFALKSSELAKSLKSDSIFLKSQRNLSLMYFYTEQYDKYVSINRSNFRLAEKLKDSGAITVAASNLGSLYRYLEKVDSSYYYYSKALKYYKANEISEGKATALLYLAEIQQLEKIYTGAEEAAVKSILILNRLPETQNRLDKLWNAYNILGIVSRELGNYSKSLEYYDKSSEFAKRIDDGLLNEVYSINNKAYVYRQIGNFDKALELYNDLLDLRAQYEEKDPTFYPIIIDNIADTQLESGNYDFNSIQGKFNEAYAIGQKLENDILVMNIAIDLSKLYKEVNQKDSISKYADKALEIASRLSANEVRQEALLILSEINSGEKGKDYLNEHIRLSDSLLIEERKVRNKFARVEFDSDQLEAENEQIAKERLYLLILSVGLLLTAILIYVIITQRAKNKELKMVQEQQKANEEIYNLMLNQQDKVEEARAQEKIRVSKELHDGVLGRLFGTRLSLDSLNFTEGKEAIKSRAEYIGQLKTIEEDIRKISHELNTDFVSGSGFMDIVSELIETQSNAYGLKHSFHYTDDINWDIVSNKVKINLYRIIQESMQNIYKHAEAKQMDISISLKNDVIWVKIIDDGKGFDADRGRKGIGLKNMQSRIKEIEGSIEFLSEPNKGTTVHVKLPYN